MVSVMRFSLRSITTLEMPALGIRASTYLRILCSSTNLSANDFPPNQLESQPRMMPKRRPIGLIFCPILFCYGFFLCSDLSNLFFLLCRRRYVVYHKRHVIGTFAHPMRASLRRGTKAFQNPSAAHVNFSDHQVGFF